MGLMDRIKRVTGTNDNYDDNYDDDYYNNFGDYDNMEEDGDMQMGGGQNQGGMGPMGAGGNMDMGGGSGNNGSISLSGQNVRMKIVRPRTYANGSQIARYLLNKCAVVLNLENTNRETARRLIDFLSGVAFSIDGTVEKVANNTYVIAPSNVDVNADESASDAPKRQRREESEPSKEDQGADFEDFD